MDITFHYPPDLFERLIDTLPLLCRSKQALLLFFEGAGVDRVLLADLRTRVEQDRDSIRKSEIARTLLTRLNQRGEVTLRERREILKRVIEFEEFSGCWPEDAPKAKGLVSEIRQMVNVKDAFTRMKQEVEKERQKRQSERQAQLHEIEAKQSELKQIRHDLFSLFSMPAEQGQKRGKLLEGVLNRLFQANGILVREAFALVKEPGKGVTEQIDGVVEIDGYLYLVEMKWWKEPLGKQEVSPHLVNIFTRGHAGGIIISNSGYTQPAIETCVEALAHKIVVLCELEEIVILLEQQRLSLTDFLKAKVRMAITDKKPLFNPLKS